jgi:hypothetical protein
VLLVVGEPGRFGPTLPGKREAEPAPPPGGELEEPTLPGRREAEPKLEPLPLEEPEDPTLPGKREDEP